MNRKKSSNKLFIIFSSIGLLLVAGVIAGFIFQEDIRTAMADARTSIDNQGKPKFSFDTTRFPDWATNGNVYNDPSTITEEFQGDENDIPVSSMTVMQCVAGSNCNTLAEQCNPQDTESDECRKLSQSTTDTSCFVMAFYKARTIDPEQEVKRYIQHVESFGDITARKIETKLLTMQMPDGAKEYQFHYYEYQRSGGGAFMRGNAIGFVPLSNGYVDVRSICSEASRLDETLPVLSAIGIDA